MIIPSKKLASLPLFGALLTAALITSGCSGGATAGKGGIGGVRVKKGSDGTNQPGPQAIEMGISTEQILHAQILMAAAASNLTLLGVAGSGSLPLPGCKVSVPAPRTGWKWETKAAKPGSCGPAELGKDMKTQITVGNAELTSLANSENFMASLQDNNDAAVSIIPNGKNPDSAPLTVSENAVKIVMNLSGQGAKIYTYEFTNIKSITSSATLRYLDGNFAISVKSTAGAKNATSFMTNSFILKLEKNNVVAMKIDDVAAVSRTGTTGKLHNYSLISDTSVEDGWQTISADADGLHIGSGQWMRTGIKPAAEILGITEAGIAEPTVKTAKPWKCKALGFCAVGE